PDGHVPGREPDGRGAGADRRGLRARRPAHLRTRRRHHVKLVTFEHAETGVAVGHVVGDEIVLLAAPTMREYFERGGAEEGGRRVSLAEARLLPPIVPK